MTEVGRLNLPLQLLIPVWAGVLINAAFAGSEAVAQPAVLRPNILLLLADDLGYETLGCFGGLDFQTPHLDHFATQGMRFTRAYTSPVCTPSRMSLYTGTYVSRHRFYDVLPVHQGTRIAVNFRTEWRTFPQLLREAGYATSVTGKWQLAALEFRPEHCRDAGFDSWCVWQIWRDGGKTTRYWNPCFNHDGRVRTDIDQRFGPDVLADYVVDQMRSAVKANQPFYIHHNLLLPHIPIVETPADKTAGRPASLDNMVAYLDHLCGRILTELDSLGVADETIVIFMGDNGTDSRHPRQTIRGPVTGGKYDLNDGGTHIPLIVRYPGQTAANSTCDRLVDMADWFPTICELTHVSVPADVTIDGISFASALRGETLQTHSQPSRRWVSGGIHRRISLFDGQWRITSETDRIIDARSLPQESSATQIPDDAAAQLRELQTTMQLLQNTPRSDNVNRD